MCSSSFLYLIKNLLSSFSCSQKLKSFSLLPSFRETRICLSIKLKWFKPRHFFAIALFPSLKHSYFCVCRKGCPFAFQFDWFLSHSVFCCLFLSFNPFYFFPPLCCSMKRGFCGWIYFVAFKCLFKPVTKDGMGPIFQGPVRRGFRNYYFSNPFFLFSKGWVARKNV